MKIVKFTIWMGLIGLMLLLTSLFLNWQVMEKISYILISLSILIALPFWLIIIDKSFDSNYKTARKDKHNSKITEK